MITKIVEILSRFGAILEIESGDEISEDRVEEVFKNWGVNLERNEVLK
jgi:ribosomal protein L12E/L44/L45/RPP1/RPP2